MARIDDRVRRFIVHSLACYDTPSQVAAAVKEEFGIDLRRQQVAVYDPTKVSGRDLSKKWRAIFEADRKKFLEQAAEIPVAHQAYRLKSLQRLIDIAMSRNNAPLAAQLLEQAAKEVGGAFTNRREHSGPGGGPIESLSTATIHGMTDADLQRIAAGGS